MTREFAHEPVMAEEVVSIIEAVPAGLVIDATVGAGGHAQRILDARPDLSILGLDRDETAVAAARRTLSGYGDRATVVHTGFEHLDGAAHDAVRGTDMEVVGVLFDLGVSSPQLDEPHRGFSFRSAAPLDMRMDTSQTITAATLVNEAEERELARLIRTFGEDRFAKRIAREIVRRRPLETTEELSDAVKAAVPAPARRTGGHPARRTFQAIRIAVNDELAHLEAGLALAFASLAVAGRMAVLSYHSLEDRMVKRRFDGWATGGLHPPGLPTRESARGGVARLLSRKPLRPSVEEIARNPRAESARLRALEKTGEPT